MGRPRTVPAEEGAKEEEAVETDIEKPGRWSCLKAARPARIWNAGKKALKTENRKAAVPPEAQATLENLWITADETVDWTEALLSETSRDGLTGPKLWSFYHRMAPKVLAGDTGAYAEVLTTINPLGDLTEYVAGMILRTPGPDRLECVFDCQRDDLEQHGPGLSGRPEPADCPGSAGHSSRDRGSGDRQSGGTGKAEGSVSAGPAAEKENGLSCAGGFCGGLRGKYHSRLSFPAFWFCPVTFPFIKI